MIGDVEVHDLKGAMNVSYDALEWKTNPQPNVNISYGSTIKLEWRDSPPLAVYLLSFPAFQTRSADRPRPRRASMP
jgi:hypothetical protein